jgi:hypothetical protein
VGVEIDLLHLLPASGLLTCLSFTSVGPAHFAVRVAARLYSSDTEDQVGWENDWLADVLDMKPYERPVHVTSLLGLGLTQALFVSPCETVLPRARRVYRLSRGIVGAWTQRARCQAVLRVVLGPILFVWLWIRPSPERLSRIEDWVRTETQTHERLRGLVEGWTS